MTSIRRKLTIGATIVIVLLLYITVRVLARQRIVNHQKDGSLVEMRLASLYQSMSQTRCDIDITSSMGKKAHICLYQDLFNMPIIVLPANSNVYICIYDYDVDFRLIRFDLNHAFQALPDKHFPTLTVLSSTCKVDEVVDNGNPDWIVARKTFESLSTQDYKNQVALYNLLLISLPPDRETVLNELKSSLLPAF